MEAMKLHCQKRITAVLQVSAPRSPQLSLSSREAVIYQKHVAGSGISGKQTSAPDPHLRQEKLRMPVSSVLRDSSTPIVKTVPANPTAPAPSAQVHLGVDTVKISERLSNCKSPEKALGSLWSVKGTRRSFQAQSPV